MLYKYIQHQRSFITPLLSVRHNSNLEARVANPFKVSNPSEKKKYEELGFSETKRYTYVLILWHTYSIALYNNLRSYKWNSVFHISVVVVFFVLSLFGKPNMIKSKEAEVYKAKKKM